MPTWTSSRFALPWFLLIGVALAALQSPWAAWGLMVSVQVCFALVELVPALRHSPPATASTRWHRLCVQLHVPLQLGLLAVGVWVAQSDGITAAAAVALGIGIGGVTGSQGITFAHELGHSKSKVDRFGSWVLMGSVLYSHFMVEHYRGHHPRAATFDDPASARYGESLWRFLPRTLVGSWRSAWALEAQRLTQFKRGWRSSPLLWATLLQAVGLAALAVFGGGLVLLFWVVQAVYAVFLLETINYIEHYGLQRQVSNGRREPFAVQHAWNADHALTNAMTANLQRHSDHHMHAWKPFATLEPLPGPQLPTGYSGCIFLATVPRLWFRVMHPRLAVGPGQALPASA